MFRWFNFNLVQWNNKLLFRSLCGQAFQSGKWFYVRSELTLVSAGFQSFENCDPYSFTGFSYPTNHITLDFVLGIKSIYTCIKYLYPYIYILHIHVCNSKRVHYFVMDCIMEIQRALVFYSITEVQTVTTWQIWCFWYMMIDGICTHRVSAPHAITPTVQQCWKLDTIMYSVYRSQDGMKQVSPKSVIP